MGEGCGSDRGVSRNLWQLGSNASLLVSASTGSVQRLPDHTLVPGVLVEDVPNNGGSRELIASPVSSHRLVEERSPHVHQPMERLHVIGC